MAYKKNLCDDCKHFRVCVIKARAYEAIIKIKASFVIEGELIWQPLRCEFVVSECEQYDEPPQEDG